MREGGMEGGRGMGKVVWCRRDEVEIIVELLNYIS